MFADSHSWSPVETVPWGTLSPTYPFRFNGPGYLYCRWCAHYIRLVCCNKTGVSCSDCGKVLAIVPQSFIQEVAETTNPDPLATHV